MGSRVSEEKVNPGVEAGNQKLVGADWRYQNAPVMEQRYGRGSIWAYPVPVEGNNNPPAAEIECGVIDLRFLNDGFHLSLEEQFRQFLIHRSQQPVACGVAVQDRRNMFWEGIVG